MSFLKIKDPLKREQTVKEFLALKKRIRDSNIAEKTGDIELQTDLSKFFRPLTKSQKEIQEEATRTITEGLVPIREGIQQLPGAITEGLAPIREGIIRLPVQLSKEMKTLQLRAETPPPSYYKVTVEENESQIRDFTKAFSERLENYKGNFDDIYRIVFNTNLENFEFGKHVILYDPLNNTLSSAKNTYIATDGLWELILSKNPKNYTKKDLISYQNLIYLSDVLFKDNDPKNELKMYNRFSEKWINIIEPVYNYIKKEKKKTGKGLRKKKTTTVIPPDPNALLERLDLLMASKGAGNTGVRNELVSICDDLKRQRVLDTKTYKKLMSII